MAVQPGRYRLGPDHGRLILRTARDGLAATAGHDLTIEVPRWSGELTVSGNGDGPAPAALGLRIELGSLLVRRGTGGVKPLTDRDRREIAVTARKVLGTDRHPDAEFTADSFQAGPDDGWLVSGSLTLNGQTGPVQLRVSQTGDGRFRATASVRQTQYGIKPYTAFLGALKVRDAVDIEADAELADPDAGAGAAS
ncbi:MAG: YceI family protein [Gemmatimonadota bacterium]